MTKLQMMSTVYTIWPLFITVTLAIPSQGKDDCSNDTCKTVCDQNSGSYKPQVCDSCNCFARGKDGGGQTDILSTEERLNEVEESLSELKVMTGVLLALVLLLLLAFLLLFLQRNNNILLKLNRALFGKRKGDTTKEKAPQTNGTVGNQTTTVGRLANHQSDCSPQLRRPSEHRLSTLGDTSLEPQPRPFRVRQPSESTCPEEGNDIPPQGYDNLALSTSTIDTNNLHNTSNSSTDTLGPAIHCISTNTLDTTLPSLNHLPSNGHINTRI